MWQSLEIDPRLVEAEAGWSACMAEEGYAFATKEDLENYFWPNLDDLENAGGFDALMEGVITKSDVQALADEELAIAAADVACRADLDQVHEALRSEYQSEFIDERHR
jgi:hypothetical protein